MEANELMIGDWVKLDFYDNAYADKEDAVWKNGKITAIHHGNWVDINFGGPLDECDIEVEDIQPIPLTPEILEKNGFKVYEQDFTSNNVYKFGCFDFMEFDRFYKCFNIGSKITYRGCGREVTYIHSLMQIHFVHQLQHALRLCGIEKDIEL